MYHKNLVDINMYTKLHKNRAVDPPPLTPREVHHRRSRLEKAGVIAEGGTPASATPRHTPPRIRRRVRASQICHRRAPSGPPPSLPKPTTPRNCRRPWGLGCAAAARSLRERHRRSILGERHRRSPSSGRHRRWPPGLPPPLAHPREPAKT
jgi:hypothetical protein